MVAFKKEGNKVRFQNQPGSRHEVGPEDQFEVASLWRLCQMTAARKGEVEVRWLGRISISHKVNAITMLTTCIALLIASGSFVVYEMRSFQKTTERELSTIAQLISETSIPALTFDDAKTAGESLAVPERRVADRGRGHI